VGSIGVISAGFGFDKAIEKLGIERRVYTSGSTKSILDPFKPEKAEDIERLKAIQREVHESFIAIVKERRGARLAAPDEELFSGAFWAGPKATQLGLIDGIADVRTKMRELHGDQVRLRVVPFGGGGLLSRLRRPIGFSLSGLVEAPSSFGDVLAGDMISAIEARALWSRFGL
jgi:ClpP class serine protease